MSLRSLATPLSTNGSSPRNALDLLFEDIESEDAKRWYSQSFNFHGEVLVQNGGGPCGVLAVIQAHVILHIKFASPGSTPEEALRLAVWEILLRSASPNSTVTLVQRRADSSKAFSPSESLTCVLCSSPRDEKFTKHEMFDPSSPSAVILFVMSLLLTRDLARVRREMDDSDALLTGRFAHCGQELINLMLTGRGSSQLHDFEIEHVSGMKLQGVFERPRVGLLSQLETYRLVKVGSFLKNPEFPIWIVASESHFSVLYSEDMSCDAKSSREVHREQAQRVFHNKDVQENGFVQHSDLKAILTSLLSPKSGEEISAMEELIDTKLGGDICLWTDFWSVIGPMLRSGKTLSDVANESRWACPQCTLLNPKKAKQCEVCMAAAPPSAPLPDWVCSRCAMSNLGTLSSCMMCGNALREEEDEPFVQRTLVLYHVNGLQRTVQGKVMLPVRSPPIYVTTVDPALAFNGSSKAFEEVVQTKWTGAVLEYGEGGTAPSIVG